MTDWHPYRTHRPHGSHPAGSLAWVSIAPEDWRLALLRFPNGETLTLPRAYWAFPETPLSQGPLKSSPFTWEEDERFFRSIQLAFPPARRRSSPKGRRRRAP